MKHAILLSMTLLLLGTTAGAQQGDLDDARAELAEVNRIEQEAFVDGSCGVLLELLAEDVTFFMNGRKVPKAGVGAFCERIPRPFPRTGEDKTSIRMIAPNAGYVLKTMTFPGTPRVEVVTKIWEKGPAGWRMLHFQSTVMDLPSAGGPPADG